MKKRIINILRSFVIATVALFILSIISCGEGLSDETFDEKKAPEVGSISLVSGPGRALNISDIKSVDLTVLGEGMTPIEKKECPRNGRDFFWRDYRGDSNRG